MQDADRVAHVETLPQPARHRGSRVQVDPVCLVARTQRVHGIARYRGRRRDLRHDLTVRATEAKLATRLSIELIAFFVDGAVVPATEQGEIRERSRASLCPVTNVMALTEPHSAAREAAAAVAMVERAPYRRWNRARTRADFDSAAVPAVLHHHQARVARDAPRRFRGNARAVFEEGLAGLIGVGKDRRIDVDDDLVARSRGAGIEAVMERRLGE